MTSKLAMQRDKVILFDLGGVLIENTGQEGLMSLLPYPLDTSDIWGKWLGSPAVRQFEAGSISAETFASRFVEEWRLEVDPAGFIEAFASWPKGLFPGARELLETLKIRHRLACLSNTNAIHWGRFPDFSLIFDICFASHEMGVVKPDRAAYQYALDRLGVPATSVYYFDDLLQNVDAARSFGFNAFHVSGFAAIAPILRRERLL